VGRACSANREEEYCLQGIVKKVRGKETTRKTKIRWVDNVKTDLVGIGWGGVDWTGLDWSGPGRVQVKSSCECCNEPSGSIKHLETIKWIHNV
jgi:hypothetical protein